MTRSRTIGITLVALGAVMCSLYLVPTVYGALVSRLAIAEFHATRSQTVAWDRTRVRAYRRTLKQHFATEAVLTIPRLHVEVPVIEGTSDLTLNRGVGHIAGTALPGESGNIAITGHRDGFFRPLKDAQRGDVIELQREDGTDDYIVRDMKIVSPSDTAVLQPTGSDTLTLITCYPFYYVGSAPQRYVVQASRIVQTPLAGNAALQVRSNSLSAEISGD